MPRQGRRLHRLPQRLDYTLIPAPLDLSFPLASEKSSLPAIIVTPSSPTECDSQFFIAFSPKPTLKDRISTYFQSPFQIRARTALILSLLIIVMMFHLFTHQFAVQRAHLRFDTFEAGRSHEAGQSYWSLFGISSVWNATDVKRDFIIDESLAS